MTTFDPNQRKAGTAHNQALHADPGRVGASSTGVATAAGFPEIEAWCPQALGW